MRAVMATTLRAQIGAPSGRRIGSATPLMPWIAVMLGRMWMSFEGVAAAPRLGDQAAQGRIVEAVGRARRCLLLQDPRDLGIGQEGEQRQAAGADAERAPVADIQRQHLDRERAPRGGRRKPPRRRCARSDRPCLA
jgi:hypothetical protein